MNSAPPQPQDTARDFTQLLSPTRRGARLARLLTVEQLRAWELPPGTIERAEQIVAEFAANAVLHGVVGGRGFRIALAVDAETGALRVEVTDARGDRLPDTAAVQADDPALDGESGRGLFLVAVLADRWGAEPYPPGGKTLWAEVDQ
ncbi:ATP-binding protein [Streptomyces sp. cg40]|uniref:ATP-binding protein n=1 Tax=Streptomyces sp. cg40 TaxID=3419764 RepID=UPI003D090E21